MIQWRRVLARFLTGGLAWLVTTAHAGESQRSISVLNVEANWHPRVEGGVVIQSCCFSPAEMDQIVRRYARTMKVQFDFGTAHAKVFIPRTTNYMAYVWYAPGKDKPALLCKLDFNGRVLKSSIGRAARSPDEVPAVLLGTGEPTVESGIPEGTSNGMSPEQVDAHVREFVREQKINFDFLAIKLGGVAIPRSRSYLVNVFYRHGWGQPSLSCKLGLDGKVTEIHVGTARPD